jgi:hypothetical protein
LAEPSVAFWVAFIISEEVRIAIAGAVAHIELALCNFSSFLAKAITNHHPVAEVLSSKVITLAVNDVPLALRHVAVILASSVSDVFPFAPLCSIAITSFSQALVPVTPFMIALPLAATRNVVVLLICASVPSVSAITGVKQSKRIVITFRIADLIV